VAEQDAEAGPPERQESVIDIAGLLDIEVLVEEQVMDDVPDLCIAVHDEDPQSSRRHYRSVTGIHSSALPGPEWCNRHARGSSAA